MSVKSVLTRKRTTVGAYTVDLHMNSADNSRQAVLLVHGIGVSSRYFIPFASQLAAEYRVIAVDLPGYGRTPKPRRALSIPELADVVIKLTHQLGLKQPIIVGQSMGCQISARAVQGSPAMFSKMLLIGPTVNARERNLPMQALRLLQDTLHEPVAVNFIILRDYLRMGFWRYLRTCRYMLRDRIEESLAGCKVPTMIVRGEEDKIVPAEWVRALCKITPDADFREIPDSPHAAQYTMPVHLAAIFREFAD